MWEKRVIYAVAARLTLREKIKSFHLTNSCRGHRTMSVNIILVDTKGHIEKDMHTQMRNHSAYIIIIVLTVVQEEFLVKLISFDNLSYSCRFKTKNSYFFWMKNVREEKKARLKFHAQVKMLRHITRQLRCTCVRKAYTYTFTYLYILKCNDAKYILRLEFRSLPLRPRGLGATYF